MPFSEVETTAPPQTSTPREHADSPGATWQERALERSLGDARARSVERLASLVDAARSLASESGSSSFTVQQVVERAGQSLKSFYRHFESKDDLLLALLEEDIAVGSLFLAEMTGSFEDPVVRVRAWLTGLFELFASGEQGYVELLVREHHRLGETHPEQMDLVVRPFVSLLALQLDRASATGAIRPCDVERDAWKVFNLALASIHELVTGRDARRPDEVAEDLWQFCWSGLRGTDASTRIPPYSPPSEAEV